MPPRSMKTPNGAIERTRAGDLLADLEAAEQLVALLAALLVEGDLLGQDQAVRLAVDLEDLEPELAADERLQLLGDLLGRVARLVVLRPAREVDDLADRHEAADAAVDDEAALVVVDDRRLDDDARLELLLHRAPLALEAGAAQRQDDVALGRLRLEDVDEDGVADRRAAGWPSRVAAEQLAVADDAFALGADVDEDLVLVDPDDGALDHVAVLEALDVRVLLGEQLLHRRRLGAELARAGPARALVLAVGASAVSAALGGCHRRSSASAGASAIRGATGSARRRARLRRLCGRRRRLGLGGDRRPASVDGRLGLGRRLRLGVGCGRRSVAARGGRFGSRRRLAGGGLVGDGDRRDGLFGRLVGDGGDRLRLRRGPALLLFGQRSGLSCRGFAPENHERPERRSSRRPRRSSGPW